VTGVCIIGWSHSPFGRLKNLDVEGLIGLVAQPAIADAQMHPKEIDAVFIGHFNSGFSKQNFPSSLPAQSVAELRFKPAARFENACASGSAAVFAAIDYIRSGRGRTALVIGVEKMTDATAKDVATNLLGASYVREEVHIPGGFAGVFGVIAQRYFERYGDQSDALAAIAAKNHRNGVDNPFAQIRKDLGFTFCRTESEGNPFIARPLKRTDCSPISDGAAALVLANRDVADALPKAVHFRGIGHANDFMPMSARDMTRFEGAEQAWNTAFRASCLAIDDLSFVETHDCFTVAELMEYEAMGLTSAGEGARAILEGWTDACPSIVPAVSRLKDTR
jgi:acetyl-CoA C-acetyltransferase